MSPELEVASFPVPLKCRVELAFTPNVPALHCPMVG